MTAIKTLVFSGGQIHDFKGCGEAIRSILEADDRFEVTYIEDDLDKLVDPGLDGYDIIVFYYTVGETTTAQKNALLEWVASGKGYVGVHSAADSFRGCPEYRAMVGGHFIGHPRFRPYQVMVTDPEHPIVQGVTDADPPEFMVEDEMYVTSCDSRNHVLAKALWKEDTVPVAWVKPWGEGRVFWLALGHNAQACGDPMFAKLLVNGARWAATPEEE